MNSLKMQPMFFIAHCFETHEKSLHWPKHILENRFLKLNLIFEYEMKI